MPKFICDYCEYADLENQSCYHTGWDKCQGDQFIDRRTRSESINFAKFIDEKCGNFNTSLVLKDSNIELSYEQIFSIYDRYRGVEKYDLDLEKKDLIQYINKNHIVLKITNADFLKNGLGDYLIWSKLPRLLKQNGVKSVFLSSYSPFRNEGIEKLIMLNPYIDGIVDFKPLNSIHTDTLFSINMGNKRNIMGIIHEAYGIYSEEPLTPEIYYKPKLLKEYEGSVIYDPNCCTNPCGATVENIGNYFNEKNIKIDYQLAPRDVFTLVLPNIPIIKSTDIFNWIDILYSASETYSLHTGVLVLMAAIPKSNHTVLYKLDTDNCLGFWDFENIKYVTL